jgi:hypothetical protein
MNNGTNSIYHMDEGKNFNGMRVKVTHTFSAGGMAAPLFVTVTGLNDREIPPGKDMIVVKVPGLCVGGGGVGMNEREGYAVFLRKAVGADKKRFDYYQSTPLCHSLMTCERICMTLM